jgi:hypothetical protein
LYKRAKINECFTFLMSKLPISKIYKVGI